MARVSGNIPNLVNGVSQQPAALRLPTQADEQVNCYSTVVNGLINRPPTEYIAKIADSIPENAFVHIINRDVGERYVVVAASDLLKVYDFDGVEKTVNIEKQTYTSLNAVGAVTNGTGYQVYFANSNSTLEVITTGITTATVIVQESTDAAFTSPTTVATITTNTTTNVTAVSGRFYRCRVSSYTSGTITAQLRWRDSRYLRSSDPRSKLRALTVADFTFLLNKDVTVRKNESIFSTDYGRQALVTVRSGAYGRTYKIIINGTTVAQVKTPDGSIADHTDDIDTGNLARILTEILRTGAASNLGACTIAGAGIGTTNYQIERNVSTIYIKRTASGDFTINSEDGQNGNAMAHLKDSTANFQDVPLYGYANFHLKIEGRSKSKIGDYYVICQSNEKNVWKEDIAEGILTTIDKMTMPFSLVREQDGTFTFRANNWDARDIGDDDSNPFPSFVDKQLNDVFFHKNRLGFLADENIVLSAGGDFFRFFRTTATAVLDDDPIDLSASHDKVSILVNAIPYQNNLLCFSDQTQFKLEDDGLLTPTTASLNPTTEFQASTAAKPVGVGTYVFFPVEREDFSSVQEFFVDDETRTNDAREVTANVPEYVPSGIRVMAATSNESLVLALSDNAPTKLYVYKFLYSEDDRQKIQSSWSYWEFPGVTRIHNFQFIQSQLYVVVARPGGVFLEKLSCEQGIGGDYALGFRVHLDQKINTDHAGVSSSYNAGTNRTTFTFPFTWKQAPTVVQASADAEGATGFEVPIVGAPTTYDSNQIVVEEDLTTEDVIFGIPYECVYVPSVFQVREEAAGGGLSVITEGRLQVQRARLQYSQTGYFEVQVEPLGRQPWIYQPGSYAYSFNGRLSGDPENAIGAPAIDTGSYSFPVQSRNDRVKITFRSNSYLPFAFTALEWAGQFTMKSKRL